MFSPSGSPGHIDKCHLFIGCSILCIGILSDPKHPNNGSYRTALDLGLHFLLRLKQPSGADHNLENSTCFPLKYTMDSPIVIVSRCMGKSIRMQRIYLSEREIVIIH